MLFLLNKSKVLYFTLSKNHIHTSITVWLLNIGVEVPECSKVFNIAMCSHYYSYIFINILSLKWVALRQSLIINTWFVTSQMLILSKSKFYPKLNKTIRKCCIITLCNMLLQDIWTLHTLFLYITITIRTLDYSL